MLTALNKVAGDNGIGRIDIVESRFVGKKTTAGSRGDMAVEYSMSEDCGGTVLEFWRALVA
jgi:hypothetical protein